MTIREIKELINARVLWGEDLMDGEILSACGSDLMSDVLAYVKEQTLLLTGLTNVQVIRTAEMIDVKLIVFVRGKTPAPDLLGMAEQRGIALMSTGLTLYEACGVLYQNGLPGRCAGHE